MTRKYPAYTRARIIACKGRRVSLKEPQSRWELVFVPLEGRRCREIGLSISGEMNQGFIWKWNGDDNFTVEDEKNDFWKRSEGKTY